MAREPWWSDPPGAHSSRGLLRDDGAWRRTVAYPPHPIRYNRNREKKAPNAKRFGAFLMDGLQTHRSPDLTSMIRILYAKYPGGRGTHNMTNADYFTFFTLPRKLHLDPAALEKNFYTLSRKTPPRPLRLQAPRRARSRPRPVPSRSSTTPTAPSKIPSSAPNTSSPWRA